MRKLLVAAVVLAVLGAIAWPATADRGGGGRVVATITSAGDGARVADSVLSPGDRVTFAVDPTNVKDRDLYHLWVANSCFQDGVNTYVEYLPVTYSDYRVGEAGAFTIASPSWTGSTADCVAFVWKFTSGLTPLAGATISYTVT